jgi:acyl-CoA thioesterase-1
MVSVRAFRRRHVRYSLAVACAWSMAAIVACDSGPSPAPSATSTTVTSLTASAAPAEPAVGQADVPARRPVMMFLGTSLTAGYGLPAEEAFAALIQEKLDADGLAIEVVNAGVSGDTSAGGLARIDWLLRTPISVLVIELGANDMLRGLGTEVMRANLRAILDRTRETYPAARFVIAGMRAAPNLGPTYAREFDATYPMLADEYDAALIPFLLDGVAAIRALNQPDGIHPTAEGHRLIAEAIWPTIENVARDVAKAQN